LHNEHFKYGVRLFDRHIQPRKKKNGNKNNKHKHKNQTAAKNVFVDVVGTFHHARKYSSLVRFPLSLIPLLRVRKKAFNPLRRHGD
jgi:hypothetical protein